MYFRVHACAFRRKDICVTVLIVHALRFTEELWPSPCLSVCLYYTASRWPRRTNQKEQHNVDWAERVQFVKLKSTSWRTFFFCHMYTPLMQHLVIYGTLHAFDIWPLWLPMCHWHNHLQWWLPSQQLLSVAFWRNTQHGTHFLMDDFQVEQNRFRRLRLCLCVIASSQNDP